jgi:hypothetical protein
VNDDRQDGVDFSLVGRRRRFFTSRALSPLSLSLPLPLSLSLSFFSFPLFLLSCLLHLGANNDKSGEEKEEGGWEEEKSRMKQKEKKRFDLGKNV